MPIYEFRCSACGRRTSVFVRSVASPVRAVCEHCGGRRLSRLMSRFATRRAAPGLDDPASLEDLDEGDPRSVARWARRMRDETGEDLGPEFEEMVGRIEAGEDPDELMGEDAADGGFDDEDF